MTGIVELGLLLFGSVGLVVLCHWILRNGWRLAWKGVAFVVAAFLLRAFWKMPLNGSWGHDHGPLLDAFAIAGILVIAVYIVRHRRFRRDWRPRAIAAVVALLLVALIGVRISARGTVMPTATPSPPTARAAPPSPAPSPTPPPRASAPPPPSASRRPAPLTTGPGQKPPCDDLSEYARRRWGCPP